MDETGSKLLIRVHGSPALPTLVYLPGLHGDWTLVSSFRHHVAGKVRFAEICYPRTTTWTLNDHAQTIEDALQAAGVSEGWLIGESFGSQPSWAMIDRSSRGESNFKIHGLILAGGFVKHPWPWGAKFLRFLNRHIPRVGMRGLLRLYAYYARFRHRQAPDTLASVAEFVTNRLHPDDPKAMGWRYTLVAESDVRPIARSCTLPVYHLAGLVDPIVPGPLIRRWLKRNCPGYRGTKTILRADHNVLGTAPLLAAQTVLGWLEPARAE